VVRVSNSQSWGFLVTSKSPSHVLICIHTLRYYRRFAQHRRLLERSGGLYCCRISARRRCVGGTVGKPICLSRHRKAHRFKLIHLRLPVVLCCGCFISAWRRLFAVSGTKLVLELAHGLSLGCFVCPRWPLRAEGFTDNFRGRVTRSGCAHSQARRAECAQTPQHQDSLRDR
jgi:hypothetical protein